MPFIETGYHNRDNKGDCAPAECPAGSLWEGLPPCAEHKKTQNEIANEMARLPDVVMPNHEAGPVHSEQEMEYGI